MIDPPISRTIEFGLGWLFLSAAWHKIARNGAVVASWIRRRD